MFCGRGGNRAVVTRSTAQPRRRSSSARSGSGKRRVGYSPSESANSERSASDFSTFCRSRSVPAAAIMPTPIARNCWRYAGFASSSEALSKFFPIIFFVSLTLACGKSTVTTPCKSINTDPNERLFSLSFTYYYTRFCPISIVLHIQY